MENKYHIAGYDILPMNNESFRVQSPKEIRYTTHFNLQEAKQEAVLAADIIHGIDDHWLGGPENQTAMQLGKRKQTMERLLRIDGRVMTRQAFIRDYVEEGYCLIVRRVSRIKPMTRMQHFRADNEEQAGVNSRNGKNRTLNLARRP